MVSLFLLLHFGHNSLHPFKVVVSIWVFLHTLVHVVNVLNFIHQLILVFPQFVQLCLTNQSFIVD